MSNIVDMKYVEELIDRIVIDFQMDQQIYLNNKTNYILINSNWQARIDDLRTLRDEDNIIIIPHYIYT